MSAAVTQRIVEHHAHRDVRLFSEFLPRGYRITGLYDRDGELGELVVQAKVLLGSLITYHDDLADHPRFFDPAALDYLYGATDQLPASEASRQRIVLAEAIADELEAALRRLPHHAPYARLLRFDIDQFFSANRYSALLRQHPGLGNLAESRHFGAFNMGIVAAATIDLMAIGEVAPDDLAAVREAAYLAQRAARISNVVTTIGRETREGDLSNEALIAAMRGHDLEEYLRQLERERKTLLRAIEIAGAKCRPIDLARYAQGIERLHALHLEMEGVI